MSYNDDSPDLADLVKDFYTQYNKDFYLANKEEMNESSKKFFQDNPSYHVERYRKHKKRILANMKKYRKAHPEFIRTLWHKRRAREKNAEGSFTKEQIEALYEEQDELCAYCDVPLNGNYHIDHVQPLSRGGSNFIENIVISCPTCNLSKGSKTLEEWRTWLETL